MKLILATIATVITPIAHGANFAVINDSKEKWGEISSAECAALRNEIRQIDDEARRRSTERLNEQRRNAVKRFNELKCKTFN